MSDENERSVASAGSVAGEPAAFAVVWENDERFDRYTVSFTEEAARRHATSCPSMKSKVVPLYRAPTLTDADRMDLQMWMAECQRQSKNAVDGGDGEAAERWSGRASRAAAMLERMT